MWLFSRKSYKFRLGYCLCISLSSTLPASLSSFSWIWAYFLGIIKNFVCVLTKIRALLNMILLTNMFTTIDFVFLS